MARIARRFGFDKPTDITDEGTRNNVRTRLEAQRRRVIEEYRLAEAESHAAGERVIDELQR